MEEYQVEAAAEELIYETEMALAWSEYWKRVMPDGIEALIENMESE